VWVVTFAPFLKNRLGGRKLWLVKFRREGEREGESRGKDKGRIKGKNHSLEVELVKALFDLLGKLLLILIIAPCLLQIFSVLVEFNGHEFLFELLKFDCMGA
jgi:lipopolysaccharide/colanic/teichoic acid biosynthesis glycosyltransferase